MGRVVITGMGAISPIGNNVAQNWESIKNGVNGIAPITYFDTSNQKVKVAGELKNINLEDYIPAKEIKRTDKFAILAEIAASEAIESSGLLDYEDWNRERAGIIVATGVGGLGTIEAEHDKCKAKGPRYISPYFVSAAISNIAAAKIAIKYGLTGMSSCTITACAGGTNAIGDGYRLIKHGYADVMLCGGAESCISEFGIGGFSAIKALSECEDPNRASIPFDKERKGFVMGEGSGILVLEDYDHAIKRGAKIYAELKGYGTNCDAHHVTAPNPDGTYAAKCMQMAIDDGQITKDEVDYINAHGTSTSLNDSSETKAVKAVFGDRAKSVAVSSTKSMTGHLLGASGAIEAVFTALSVQNDFLPPNIGYQNPDPDCDLAIVANKGREAKVDYALSNSFGFGGHNASLLFAKVK